MAGFVLVKKVPGTLMFVARSPGYSFDHATMNMSHVTHAFMFGGWLYGAKYRTMARMHPGGIEKFWGDKMIKDQYFISTNDHSTHEHYLQVFCTPNGMTTMPSLPLRAQRMLLSLFLVGLSNAHLTPPTPPPPPSSFFLTFYPAPLLHPSLPQLCRSSTIPIAL